MCYHEWNFKNLIGHTPKSQGYLYQSSTRTDIWQNDSDSHILLECVLVQDHLLNSTYLLLTLERGQTTRFFVCRGMPPSFQT